MNCVSTLLQENSKIAVSKASSLLMTFGVKISKASGRRGIL
jgi:hypothetical protein